MKYLLTPLNACQSSIECLPNPIECLPMLCWVLHSHHWFFAIFLWSPAVRGYDLELVCPFAAEETHFLSWYHQRTLVDCSVAPQRQRVSLLELHAPWLALHSSLIVSVGTMYNRCIHVQHSYNVKYGILTRSRSSSIIKLAGAALFHLKYWNCLV